MHISDLPDRSQDYLKTIWDITELLDDQPAALGDIAEKMNQKTPTASEAIKSWRQGAWSTMKNMLVSPSLNRAKR